MRLPFLAALIAALGAATPAHADIYKFVDDKGVVHLSDRPMGPGSRLILRTPGSRASSANVPRKKSDYAENRRRYGPMIDRVAGHFRLDRSLVHAVVHVESAYDPEAVSRAGAVGLMQLMPGTARRYGVRDRRDPKQNVTGGVRYLRDLLVQFNDVVLALAAYNAGENAVARHGNRVPPFPETRTYVRRVLTQYRQLRTTSG